MQGQCPSAREAKSAKRCLGRGLAHGSSLERAPQVGPADPARGERRWGKRALPVAMPVAPDLLGEKAVIFRALACDYDGTLASHDLIGPEALEGLGRAREAGLRLLLVTGRTFFELVRVCERLDLFDAVVAENGAVLYYPRGGMIRDQAPPPPLRLLAELDRRGIHYEHGRVIVGTGRSDEARVRAALEAAGVGLDLVYNRGALMLLPAGISKGTGVRQVVRGLGLSYHDVLALGDAENDLALFDVCGWAGCPSNAVPALRERADWVFPGNDGDAIGRALTEAIVPGTLPVSRSPRHRIPLGWAVGSAEPVTIPERGVNVLIQGDPLAGKSWLAGALIERLVGRRYAVCVIDPEGDYRVLRRLAGVSWAAIDSPRAMERALGRFERDPAACVVADLSELSHADKLECTAVALATIRALRRRVGLPHWVVLDEAHYSLHGAGVAAASLGLEDKGFCLASYRGSWITAAVVEAMDIWVLARTTASEELDFLRRSLVGPPGDGRTAAGVLPELSRGEFVLMESGSDGAPRLWTFAATPRETQHVRHQAKYVDQRVGPSRAFLFRRADGTLAGSAESLGEFRAAVGSLEQSVLADHARRGDFSRWVEDVFSDTALAALLRKVEARWARGEIDDLRRALADPIALRYGDDRRFR